MAVDIKDLRNVIVLGHSSCGKTSIVEQLLCDGGAISKAGSIDAGTTVSDYNEDEIERKISINSSISFLQHKKVKVNLIDTPGYNDFIGEVIGGISVADAAILVVNAVGGVEIGTDRFYKMIKKKGIPFCIVINRMDKEHADFVKCMEQIQKKFGKQCACIAYPIGKESSFKGVANILSKDASEKVGEDEKDNVKAMMESLTESVAESDDALLEKYLEQGELSPEEVRTAFKKAVVAGKVVPVISSAATKDIGIKELLDVIIDAFPSPLDAGAVAGVNPDSGEEVMIEPDTNGPFAAQSFKTISDPYLGQISIFKVFSGKMTCNMSVYNATKEGREKVGQLLTLNGKKEIQTDSVGAGDFVSIAKLKETSTGDTLCDEKKHIKVRDLKFPEPAISFSIKPKTRADEDKISNALHKLIAEDNTFTINRDGQTRELIANGMGDQHLNIMIQRLRSRFGVQVDIGTPKVAYRETITAKGGSQYRHKKQSGGAGQFAEVWMRVEPLERGVGYEFVNEVVGGSIPTAFVASCEKGVKAAMGTGILAGFPVVDVPRNRVRRPNLLYWNQ